jgi:tetratricopeptide (TPR) repeat protein
MDWTDRVEALLSQARELQGVRRNEERLRLCEEALAILSREDPDASDRPRLRIEALRLKANAIGRNVEWSRGDFPAALHAYERALEVATRLDLNVAEYLNDLANSWHGKGLALAEIGDGGSLRLALAAYDQAIELGSELDLANPEYRTTWHAAGTTRAMRSPRSAVSRTCAWRWRPMAAQLSCCKSWWTFRDPFTRPPFALFCLPRAT